MLHGDIYELGLGFVAKSQINITNSNAYYLLTQYEYLLTQYENIVFYPILR